MPPTPARLSWHHLTALNILGDFYAPPTQEILPWPQGPGKQWVFLYKTERSSTRVLKSACLHAAVESVPFLKMTVPLPVVEKNLHYPTEKLMTWQKF